MRSWFCLVVPHPAHQVWGRLGHFPHTPSRPSEIGPNPQKRTPRRLKTAVLGPESGVWRLWKIHSLGLGLSDSHCCSSSPTIFPHPAHLLWWTLGETRNFPTHGGQGESHFPASVRGDSSVPGIGRTGQSHSAQEEVWNRKLSLPPPSRPASSSPA